MVEDLEGAIRKENIIRQGCPPGEVKYVAPPRRFPLVKVLVGALVLETLALAASLFYQNNLKKDIVLNHQKTIFVLDKSTYGALKKNMPMALKEDSLPQDSLRFFFIKSRDAHYISDVIHSQNNYVPPTFKQQIKSYFNQRR